MLLFWSLNFPASCLVPFASRMSLRSRAARLPCFSCGCGNLGGALAGSDEADSSTAERSASPQRDETLAWKIPLHGPHVFKMVETKAWESDQNSFDTISQHSNPISCSNFKWTQWLFAWDMEKKRWDCTALPKGWKMEEVTRKSGLSAGKSDVYYFRY